MITRNFQVYGIASFSRQQWYKTAIKYSIESLTDLGLVKIGTISIKERTNQTNVSGYSSWSLCLKISYHSSKKPKLVSIGVHIFRPFWLLPRSLQWGADLSEELGLIISIINSKKDTVFMLVELSRKTLETT